MSISVSAVVLDEAGDIGLRDVLLPDVGPGEVRVKLAAAGVCHSDLSLANGTLRQPRPAVLGHEGAGIVEEVGAGVEHVGPGDRVVLNWAPSCGGCWHCTHDEPFLCVDAAKRAGAPYATLDDGTPVYPALGTAAFAEQTIVPAAGVTPLPDDLPLEGAAVIGCAVLTGYGAVTHTASVAAGQSVAVLGLGGVGLSVVQAARIAGANPIVAVDSSPAKRELALAAGATDFVGGSDDPGQAVRDLTGGRGADHVFEVVGTGETIKLAWSLARRGGEVTIVGVGGRSDEVSFTALELWHFARTIRPSVFGSSDPRVDVPAIAEHVRAGRLDLDSLISDRIGLADVPAAFERMLAGQGARSLIVFD
jgi:S-(hydroxymethyl)glutathione dehydrogenase/alcohol dehydrogenase